MKKIILSLMALASLTASAQFGAPRQNPTAPSAVANVEDFKPASSNQGTHQYPMVNSELMVRAQISAPNATQVGLDIAGTIYLMTKDENGVWTGTSAPQDPGFHYYQLNIDGASVPDPGSLYYYGADRWGSGIEVPSEDQDFWQVKNVPQGTMSEVYYYSSVTEQMRRCFVYLPNEYFTNPTKKFPVLYLQHGMGENEYGWSDQGHTAQIIPIVLVLLFLIYKFKADSANGRLLMWRVSMDMIKDKPLFGFGFNGFTAHYLEYQANYFINNPDSPFLLLADNVNNPFNEYILVLINYGLTGFVLLLGFIFFTLRKLWLLQKDYKIVLIALAVAIMVLGFFSYPFSIQFIWVLIAFIIMMAFCGTIRNHRTLSTTVFTVICSIGIIIGFYRFMIEREWKLIYERTLVEDMESVFPDYIRIYDQLKGNAKFLYNYGAELHYSGHYKESLQIMGECIKKDNDYDVQMIIGNSYQHLGDTIKALEHYAFANNMVPSKFKPLSLSMKLYVEKRDTVNALNIANAILAKDVKINRSKRVQRIITEAEEVINTLTESE